MLWSVNAGLEVTLTLSSDVNALIETLASWSKCAIGDMD